jgi:hypothetical protein
MGEHRLESIRVAPRDNPKLRSAAPSHRWPENLPVEEGGGDRSHSRRNVCWPHRLEAYVPTALQNRSPTNSPRIRNIRLRPAVAGLRRDGRRWERGGLHAGRRSNLLASRIVHD